MAGHFPILRVKKIMKSSAEVENISKDSTVVVTRASELFLKLLLKEAYQDSKKARKLQYRNIANVVNTDEKYEFLREMIPHKITVDEYYKMMRERSGDSDNDSDSSSRRSSSSSGSSSGSSAVEENVPKPQDSRVSDSDVIMID